MTELLFPGTEQIKIKGQCPALHILGYKENIMNTVKGLSEQEIKNYEIKKELIELEGFIDMRILTKKTLLEESLQSRGYSEERIQGIKEGLESIGKERSSVINKILIQEILLPKLEETYKEFEKKGGTNELRAILDECHKNGSICLNKYREGGICADFKLRKCAKIARGERFEFSTGKSEDNFIVLEVQKVMKGMNIKVLDDQTFFVRRHIDEDTDITKMSDILIKGKKFLDFYLKDKKIKYVLSSSWLFDDEFNDFWMKERAKEGITKIPNRVKIREEQVKNYGGKLPAEELGKDDPVEDNIISGTENSLTRAIKEYLAEGKTIKGGGGYIDLDRLEKWKDKEAEERILFK